MRKKERPFYHTIFNIYTSSLVDKSRFIRNFFFVLFCLFLAAPLLFPLYFQFVTIRHAVNRKKWLVKEKTTENSSDTTTDFFVK